MAKVAESLGITLEQLLDKCGVRPAAGKDSALSRAESYWLDMYRKLSPPEQARVLIAVEEMVKKLPDSQHRD
jgi:hypothetical protein